MKLQIALLASLLTVLPVASAADTVQNTNTYVGNASYTGSLTASNLNPQFYGSIGGTTNVFAFNAAYAVPFSLILNTNPALLGVIVNKPVNSTGWAALPIYGFSVQCIAYNPTTAAAAPGDYPYTTETNGISGGTITIQEYKPTGSPVTVGTLVFPSSPHGGPYISSVSTTLATSYTPTLNSTFTATLSALGVASQAYSSCVLTATLQGSPSPAGNG
jgi:hypothetical protein